MSARHVWSVRGSTAFSGSCQRLASVFVLGLLAIGITSPVHAQSVNGICQPARIQNAGTFPTPGTVDARSPLDAGNNPAGIGIVHPGGDDRIIVKLAFNPALAGTPNADAGCWGICETNAIDGVNTIVSAERVPDPNNNIDDGSTYRLTLAAPISVGDATVIIYDGDDLNQLVYRSHPGNVNGDSRALPTDLLFLSNAQNGIFVTPYGRFSTDINNDGVLATGDMNADAQALVALLNGSSPAGNWIGTRVPNACVNEMPDDCDACDVDLDLIPDAIDNCPNKFNPNQEETDADGVGNVCDNCPTAANTNQADADADGTGDVCETIAPPPGGGGGGTPVIPADCPKPASPGEPDTDGDGVADGCDTAPNNPNLCGDSDDDTCDDCSSGRFDPAVDGLDTDGDGLCDAIDPVDTNDCPRPVETGQPDTDGDGVANFCDEFPGDESACGDSDNDGCDDCAHGSFNPDNDGLDTNGDGQCDPPVVAVPDGDDDGTPDDADNCPETANADQADTDNDGFGNVCDNCPSVPNRSQADANNNGIGNACEEDEPGQGVPDSDGDGALDNADNCPQVANADQADADADDIGDECDNCPEISNAAQSDNDNDEIGNLCDDTPNGEDPIDNGSGDGQAGRPCGICGNGAATGMIMMCLGWLGLRSHVRRSRKGMERNV